MPTFPLTEFSPEVPSAMQTLYIENGFASVNSIEENVQFAAHSKLPRRIRDHQLDSSYRREMAAILVSWYEDVEAQCSGQYHWLKESHPTASKAEINADPELFALNTLRRAIRHKRAFFTH